MSRFLLGLCALYLLVFSGGCGYIGGTKAADPAAQPAPAAPATAPAPAVAPAPAAATTTAPAPAVAPAPAAATTTAPAGWKATKYVVVFSEESAIALIADDATYKVPDQWRDYWTDNNNRMPEASERALPANWNMWDKSSMTFPDSFKPMASGARSATLGEVTYEGIYYFTADPAKAPAAPPSKDKRPSEPPQDKTKLPKPNVVSAAA